MALFDARMFDPASYSGGLLGLNPPDGAVSGTQTVAPPHVALDFLRSLLAGHAGTGSPAAASPGASPDAAPMAPMGQQQPFQSAPANYSGGLPLPPSAAPSMPVPQPAPQQQAQGQIDPQGFRYDGAGGKQAWLDYPGSMTNTDISAQSRSPSAAPAMSQGMAPPPMSGQPAPAQPPTASTPDFLQRLTAGATNFTTGGNPIAGLMNSITGLTTGTRTDKTGIAQQQLSATANALYGALAKSGRYSPQEAQGIALAAAGNPSLAAAILPQAFGSKYTPEKVKDALGQESIQAFDPTTGTIKSTAPGGESAGAPTGPQLLAQGVDKFNSSLTGEDYLNQFSPEVKAAVKAYIGGDVMPTGNPRQTAIANFAKTIAQKYGMDTGTPVSDALYSQKRVYRSQLGSNTPNSAGGQAKAFNQGIEHMSALADTLEQLKNWDGFGIPILAQGANMVREGVSNDQAAIADKARGIGQTLSGEVGKLFSGSAGGGVEERRMTRDRFDTVKSRPQLAAALEATLETMRGGLTALEQRRNEVLGPNSDVRFVNPETEQKIAKIQETIARLKGGASPPAATAPAASGLPAGWTMQVH